MHEGMTAALAVCNNGKPNYLGDHDIDYALISHGSEPHSLNKAVWPKCKGMGKGLKYEIAQL